MKRTETTSVSVSWTKEEVLKALGLLPWTVGGEPPAIKVRVDEAGTLTAAWYTEARS